MANVLLRTVEPGETLERVVPMAHAYAMLARGGFEKCQIIDIDTRIVIYQKGGA